MSERLCSLCGEAMGDGEPSVVQNTDIHRECALRSALGGIGHLLDHAHFCHGELGPDAGLDYRTSALLVDVWVARRSVEEAAGVRYTSPYG